MKFDIPPAALRELRTRGRALTATVQVGKEGLTPSLQGHLDRLLAQHELVKVRILDAAGDDRHSLAEGLAGALSAHLVAVTGRTALLYRPNPDLKPDQRVL